MRKPIGLDDLTKTFEAAASRLGKPVTELKVLDVGCGTGNYLQAFSPLVGECYGLEFNSGMLQQVQAKKIPNVTIQQGSVLDLENIFGSDTFDVVVMTQVLHHLDVTTHATALSNMARVLKKGGALWLQTQTPHQHMNGFWWTPIIPKASALVAARFSGLPELTEQMSTAGFSTVSSAIPDEPLVAPPYYLVKEGPFNSVFRAADSTWSAATEEELVAGQKWWQGIVDAGQADSYLHEREDLRKEVGQTTCVTAVV